MKKRNTKRLRRIFSSKQRRISSQQKVLRRTRRRRRMQSTQQQQLDTGREVKAYDKFEDMNLSKKLLDGIIAYGYEKPSKAQQKALVPLREGRDVIVRGESDPLKSLTICIGVLQQINCNSWLPQALVATADHDSAVRIGKAMLKLGCFLGVKVHVFGNPDRVPDKRYLTIPNGAHVVVGTVSLLLKFLQKRPLTLSVFRMVVLDGPDPVEISNMLFHLRQLKGSFQIGVFSEFSLRVIHEFVLEFCKNQPLVITVEKQDELVGIQKYEVTGVVNNKELPEAALDVGKDERCFLEESELLDTDCKVYDEYSDIIFNKKLLGGIKACGYDGPSEAQQKALVPLRVGLDVIVQGESNLLKLSTICIGILQRLNCTSNKCQAIVATADHALAGRIGTVMLALGRYLNVKVHIIDDPNSCLISDGAHVVVGTAACIVSDLLHSRLSLIYLKMVFIDEPDHMEDTISLMLSEIHNLRSPGKPFQIAIFSELRLKEKWEHVGYWMKNPEIITVKDPDKMTCVGDEITFDAMGLTDLLQDIKEYGYDKPSAAQQKALVPPSNNRDVIVQGESNPEKISTICFWILQRLNKSGNCQALVFADQFDTALAIRSDMLQLGKSLGVKVHVLGYPSSSDLNPNEADVVVGSFDRVSYLIVEKKLFINDIRMVALDEPDQMKLDEIEFIFLALPYYMEKAPWKPYQTGVFSELRPRKMANLFQTGVFSELRLREIGNLAKCFMTNPKIIKVKERDVLTFKGIKKHQVIGVKDDNSKTEALLELFESSSIKKAVVFVNSGETNETLATLDTLVEKMSVLNGWKVCSTNMILNQNVRSKITQDLLQSDTSCVLITTEAQAKGIDFQQVHLVVNYDLPRMEPKSYLRRLGSFRGEVNAVNFVHGYEWSRLFDIQMYFKEDDTVVFEAYKTGLGFSPVCETIEPSKAADGIKHYILLESLDVDDKIDEILEDFKVAVEKTKSVIFVNASKQVQSLSKRFKEGFDKIGIFTDELVFSCFNEPCMLITSDNDAPNYRYPKEVPLVINFDLPLTMSSYDRRIACCGRNGAVVHFVTDEDWLRVLYVQSRYDCELRCIPRNVGVIVGDYNVKRPKLGV